MGSTGASVLKILRNASASVGVVRPTVFCTKIVCGLRNYVLNRNLPVSPAGFRIESGAAPLGRNAKCRKSWSVRLWQQHATPFCISEYLRNRPRAGGTTSHGANHKPNPTGGAEGSKISGLPKAGERTKTQRFRKKGVLEGLHKEGRRRGGCEAVRC